MPGETYEYRMSATFPAPDVHDANHGFAAVPSGTLLPAEFALGGPRLRVPRPVAVDLTPGTPDNGLVRITRRGIPVDPTREPFWIGPGLDDWSLVVDFATPVTAVMLELAPGHDLVYSAGAAISPFLDVDPVPSGPTPRLDFGTPVQQLRLRGKGFLHALRVPTVADTDKAELAVVVPPVTLVDTPLPAAPLAASAASLQQATAAPTNLVPGPEVAHRDALGFTVTWRPAPAFALPAWPPDLDASVPLDASVFQIERRVEPTGDWVPVLDDDNQTLGDRGGAIRELALTPGIDLATVFPDNAVQTGGTDLDMHFVDSFGVVDGQAAGGAAVPEPGSLHRYRVRTIDSVGRPSVELARDRTGAAGEARPATRAGARRRARARARRSRPHRRRAGAARHERQRGRVAVGVGRGPARPGPVRHRVPRLRGTADGHGRRHRHRCDAAVERAGHLVPRRPAARPSPSPADIVAGQRLDAGHPFFIRSHDAGSAIQMVVETRLRPGGVAPVPVAGPVSLALPLTPDRTRPPAWGTRQAVVPIHTDPADTAYEVVLRDLLTATDAEPVTTAWVGVSAADDQAYVADQLAPLDTRPGNESAIVPVQATARYHGRPELEIPPPLASVPRVRTPEPGPEPVHFTLDLTPFLPPAAVAGGRVRTERVAVATVLAACRLTDDDRIIAIPVAPPGGDDSGSEPEVEIPIANPDDRAELAAQIRSSRAEVDDRFAVYLAGHHAYRDRLFVPVAGALQPPGPFAETLPSSTGRYVYRVRAADQAGHVSAGAATATVVVRVPSLQQGTPPLKLPSAPDDPPATLRVQVAPDAALTHLVVFTAAITGIGAVATGEIMRVPNRPDLLPAGGLFLRSPEGAMLVPAAIALDDPPADGARTMLVPVPGDPGDRTRIWLATLTADGIPSPVAGPYSFVHPAAVPS